MGSPWHANSTWINYVINYTGAFAVPIAKVGHEDGETGIDSAKLVDVTSGDEIALTHEAFAGAFPTNMRVLWLPGNLNDGGNIIDGLYSLKILLSGAVETIDFGDVSTVSTVSISPEITVDAKVVDPDAWTEALTDATIKEDPATYMKDLVEGSDVYTYASAATSSYTPYHETGDDDDGHLVARLVVRGGHAPYTALVKEADASDRIRVSVDADADAGDDVSIVYLYVTDDGIDVESAHAVNVVVSDGKGRIKNLSFNHVYLRTPSAVMATPGGITTYTSDSSEGFMWEGSAIYPKRLTLADATSGSFAYSGSLQTLTGTDGNSKKYIEFGFTSDGVSDDAYTIAKSEVTYTENGYDFNVSPNDSTSFYLFKQMVVVSGYPKLGIATAGNVDAYTDGGDDILATTVANTEDVQLELQVQYGFGEYTFSAHAYELEGSTTTSSPLELAASADIAAFTDTTSVRSVVLSISNSETNLWSAILATPAADGSHTTDSKRMRLAGILTAGAGAGPAITSPSEFSANFIEVYLDFVTRIPSGYPYFPLFVDLGAADYSSVGVALYDMGYLADNGAYGYDSTALAYTLSDLTNFAVSGATIETANTFSSPVYRDLTLQITDAAATTAYTSPLETDMSFFTKPTVTGSSSITLESGNAASSTEGGVDYYAWDVTGFTYSGGYIPASGGSVTRDALSLSLTDDSDDAVPGAILEFVATSGSETSGLTCGGKVVVKIPQDPALWGAQRTLTLSFGAKSVTPAEGDAQTLWATGGSSATTVTFVNASWQLTSTASTAAGAGNVLDADDGLMTNHANADMASYANFEEASLFSYGADDTVFDTISEFTLNLTSLDPTTVGYKMAVVKVTDGDFDTAAAVGANPSVAMSSIDYDNIDDYADTNFTMYEDPSGANTSLGSVITSATEDVDGSVLRIVMTSVPAQNDRYLFMLVSDGANITGTNTAFQRRILINRFEDLASGATLAMSGSIPTYMDRIALALGTPGVDDSNYEDFVDIDYQLQGSTSVFAVTANGPYSGAGGHGGYQTVTAAGHNFVAGNTATLYGGASNVDAEVLEVDGDDVTVEVLTADYPAGTTHIIKWQTLKIGTAEKDGATTAVSVINSTALIRLPERYEDGDDGTSLNSNLSNALSLIHYRVLMRNAIGQVDYVSSAVFTGRDLSALLNESVAIEDRHQAIGPFKRESLRDDGEVLAELDMERINDTNGDFFAHGFTAGETVTEIYSGLPGAIGDVSARTL